MNQSMLCGSASAEKLAHSEQGRPAQILEFSGVHVLSRDELWGTMEMQGRRDAAWKAWGGLA